MRAFFSLSSQIRTFTVSPFFMESSNPKPAYLSSLGSDSLHILEEPEYLNPKRLEENFETRVNHRKIIDGIKHYDIIVIGGGGGISKISSPSSRQGYKVAYIERARNGGTCLNRGCIPSKMLIHTAEVADQMRFSDKFDITPPKEIVHNFEKTVEYVVNDIDGDSFSIDPALKKNPNVDWFHKPAKFIDKKIVEVDGEKITAPRIFIAAGARPRAPCVPGIIGTPYLTSTEALRLTKHPKSMIIIGAGYIAVELAFYFGALNTNITTLVRSKFIRHSDKDISDEFTRLFCKRFPSTQLGVTPKHVEYKNNEFHVTTSTGQVLVAEHLLCATGVVPNSDLLNLDDPNIGIELSKSGYIKTNNKLETSVPGVYAFGDIIGRYLFRHNANWEGEYLFRNIIYKEAKSSGGINSLVGQEDYPDINYFGMPSAVFCGLEMQNAAVGETEQALIERKASYIAVKRPFRRSAYGMALRTNSGFVKLLVERGTRKILGCHIIGYQASVLIHQVSTLFHLPGGPLLDYLLDCIYIHPSLSELIRNCARMARDELVDLGDDVPDHIRFK